MSKRCAVGLMVIITTEQNNHGRGSKCLEMREEAEHINKVVRRGGGLLFIVFDLLFLG